MVFVVPFDSSELAEAALVRATEYGALLNQDIVVVTVIPERNRYAREKGWIGENETVAVDVIADQLRDRVKTLAPEASFEYKYIREFPPESRLAGHIERLILEHEPSVVFLGSDNVGRIVTPLTSVGAHVAADHSYDVFIVRQPTPPSIDSIEAHATFYGEDGV
ncbi:hypothetical protein C482_02716 [Natrialba chahannaoensis JCM 10990]|uniref:Uncharacterized protein n=1 Tax=Natrialba chahannaoensis JCM 10990 TaxID=1227492 RepID=M0B2C5_9EURY|nr:universal stress protein [Natrialba chahannaoensis]ELZ05031.1 hypothetical protein C482_02716 [Natrialba chahannaoensis JCM 10990]